MMTPEWVVKIPNRLHPYARLVYAALISYLPGDVWAGVETLAFALGLSERTVRKYMRELETYGLVTISRRWNDTNVYRVQRHEHMPDHLALSDDVLAAEADRRERARDERNARRGAERNDAPTTYRRQDAPTTNAPGSDYRTPEHAQDAEMTSWRSRREVPTMDQHDVLPTHEVIAGLREVPTRAARDSDVERRDAPTNQDHIRTTSGPARAQAREREIDQLDDDLDPSSAYVEEVARSTTADYDIEDAEVVEDAPASESTGWGAGAPADEDELEEITVSEPDDEIETADADDEPGDELTEEDIALVHAKYWAMKDWATTQGPEKFDTWMRVQRLTAENKIRDARLEPEQVDQLSAYARSIYGRAA